MTEPTTLRLGCGTDTKPAQWNVDRADLDGVDQVVDLTEIPWPWRAGRWERIVANHVFEHLDDIEAVLRECARVLESGGELVVRVPIGYDAKADPDHVHEWVWSSPEMYCGARHWDTDVGLTVVDRDVSLDSLQQGAIWHLHTAYLKRKLARYEPGPWCFVEPGVRGEFTVVFEA